MRCLRLERIPMGSQVRVSYAHYRLRFKRPFAIAHGTRDGTDAVFLRLEQDGATGYGEATLPPYLNTSITDVADAIGQLAAQGVVEACVNGYPSMRMLDAMDVPAEVRAALHMAVIDLVANGKGVLAEQLLEAAMPGRSEIPQVLFTLSASDLGQLDVILDELPEGIHLKVKVSGKEDARFIDEILGRYAGGLLLDGNQGCTDVGAVLRMVDRIGEDRLLGIEQPFKKENLEAHRQLNNRTAVPVIADESAQGPEDLERVGDSFAGVNIKLMKCGGLDRAQLMIHRARELGLAVMLGCMSESSLGCAAMGALRDSADLVDLDGPWLLSNDPFSGIRWDRGSMQMIGSRGFGVNLGASLDWIRIGA